MGSLSSEAGNDERPLPEDASRFKSSAESRLTELKEGLVWQVLSRSGEFWEKIRDMRSRWGITARAQLPPEVSGPLRYLKLPKQYPRSKFARLQEPTLYPRDMEIPERNKWEWELDWIKVQTVPERYSQASEWRWFISACVLFDPPASPPEPGLVRFAECGGVTPDIVGRGDGDGFEMLVSPVWKLSHPFAVEGVWRWFLNAVMREINERHLKPRGLNIYEMFSDVLQNSGLEDELQQRLERIPLEDYIKVDELTTYKEVEAGRKAIVAEQRRKKEGAPRLRPLVAMECALLHDRYNSTDPTDRRRRRWTHQRLAERYELRSRRTGKPSPRRAKEYVAYGRELLEKIE